MTRRQFEALVERALRRLPRKFKDKLANIAVVVEDWPDDETLADLGIEPPDTVTIYQGPIEEDCADEEEMAELVRETVIHELGHYFGLDDETMERIEDSDV